MVEQLAEKHTLKQWRLLRGLTQKELAASIGITDKTLSLYEHDIEAFRKIPYERLRLLTNILEISLNDIFLDSISEKPN